MITKYSKKRIEGYPKEVILGACVEVNDENMEHVFGRDDIGVDELREMVRILRKGFFRAKSEAKRWGEECYEVKGELIKLKSQMHINGVIDRMLEEVDE